MTCENSVKWAARELYSYTKELAPCVHVPHILPVVSVMRMHIIQAHARARSGTRHQCERLPHPSAKLRLICSSTIDARLVAPSIPNNASRRGSIQVVGADSVFSVQRVLQHTRRS